AEAAAKAAAEKRRQALTHADARMQEAKSAFSRAALASMRGAPDSVTRVREALDLVQQARAELAALQDDDART
ncbi:MAG: hypothetical protein ACREVG_00685, partial [Burkholderiales bacterium]